MAALQTILSEVKNLRENELHQLIHYLVDKIHTPHNDKSGKPVENPFRKYRGRANGAWQQDAQAYIQEIRDEERF
ncbi:MAG: hypothetical protein GY801_17810 [bacterium]|nr:hypothetical protein [bacterium]